MSTTCVECGNPIDGEPGAVKADDAGNRVGDVCLACTAAVMVAGDIVVHERPSGDPIDATRVAVDELIALASKARQITSRLRMQSDEKFRAGIVAKGADTSWAGVLARDLQAAVVEAQQAFAEMGETFCERTSASL